MKKLKISISIQILIFTLLVVFLPAGSILLLKTYEKQQLASLENSLVQQGRIFAASLSDNFSKENADQILKNMNQRFDARIRILDVSGLLISDSSKIINSKENSETDESINSSMETQEEKNVQPERSLIYRTLSFPIRLYRKFFRPPAIDVYGSADYYNNKTVYDGREVAAALEGRYGAITRISSGDQISVTLYSAIPVMENNKVIGVILVSRSTYKILQNLYELRRDIAKIFLWSLLLILAVTIFFYFRISFPLKKLAKETQSCTDQRGHLVKEKLTGARRNDEIGELSRSFSNLLKKLADRIRFTESFSADLSHEFKNPLAAIRLSAELMQNESSPEQNLKSCSAITDEVSHLEMLLSGIRRLSQIDSEDSEKELIPCDLFLENITKRIQLRHKDKNFSFSLNCSNKKIEIDADLLDRMTENLLENACSFGNKIFIESKILCEGKKEFVQISIHDDGPGISNESLPKIFDRFYSTRKNKDNHSGLGLPLVKAVCENAGGNIQVLKSPSLGGACFTVILPGSKELEKK
ncbi:MAG: ATP-binding protein [Treponema sp.]|nr:ATP-binding protein [Treponema sp.]